MASFDDGILLRYDKLGIRSNSIKGRYGEALLSYKRGDLVLVEEPYAMVINQVYRSLALRNAFLVCF